MLITESRDLIEDFRAFDEAINQEGNIGFTKIIKKRDGTFRAVSVLEKDKIKLRDGNP